MRLGDPTGSQEIARRRRRRRLGVSVPRLPIDPRSGLGLLVGLALILSLASLAAGLQQYWRSFAQNTAADMIGAVLTIYVITPIIERSDQNAVRERPLLDIPAFIARVRQATTEVRILDTCSPLLLEPHAKPFLEAVRAALANGASVQILLLNPTTLAAEQRALELGDPDLDRKVQRNLDTLRTLWKAFDDAGGGLPGRPAGAHFEVRLYASAPSIAMHQWDDRALVAFFPGTHRAYERRHLEVSVNTGVGQFLENQFQELWKDAARHEALTRVTLDGGAVERTYMVKYVDLFGRRYVVSTRVENYISHAPRRVIAYRGDNTSVRYTLRPVDPHEQQILGILRGNYRTTYGEPPKAHFLQLVPIPQDDPEGPDEPGGPPAGALPSQTSSPGRDNGDDTDRRGAADRFYSRPAEAPPGREPLASTE